MGRLGELAGTTLPVVLIRQQSYTSCLIQWLTLYVFNLQILFSIGFSLAAIYHVCHIQEEGLQSSTFLGISGPLWRTGDIIVAQWMLARTFGHAVGASHCVTKGL